jgi:hypothetical protein
MANLEWLNKNKNGLICGNRTSHKNLSQFTYREKSGSGGGDYDDVRFSASLQPLIITRFMHCSADMHDFGHMCRHTEVNTLKCLLY